MPVPTNSIVSVYELPFKVYGPPAMLSALPEATWYSTQVKWVSVMDLIRRCSLGKSEKSFASPYLKEINCQVPRWEAPALGVSC